MLQQMIVTNNTRAYARIGRCVILSRTSLYPSASLLRSVSAVGNGLTMNHHSVHQFMRLMKSSVIYIRPEHWSLTAIVAT